MNCLFCQIANRELNADIIYEDDNTIAFSDVNPQAPTHKLIIPRKHIATLNDLTPEDAHLIGDMMLTAQKLAKNASIAEDGYRLVLNVNPGAGQSVFHIHMHLLGGRNLTWPPG